MTDSHLFNRTDSVDELVRQARTERDAFGQLFDRFYPSVLTYCVRRLLVRAVAEDVASEAFLKVATGIRAFPGTSEEDFRRWLFRIVTNEVNAQLRKSIRRRELLEEAARMGVIRSGSVADLLNSDMECDWQCIYEALGQLSERDQSLVSLRFFAGLQHEQIADVLGMRKGTARVALSRALERLRGRLHGCHASRRSPARNERGGQQHE